MRTVNTLSRIGWITIFAFGVLFLTISIEAKVFDDKIDVKEVVNKHLASIGSDKARETLRSLMIVGTTQAVFKGRGEGRADGLVVMASHSEKNMIGMKFNAPDYPHEKMGYDGNGFSVGFVTPGKYTILGEFLRLNEGTFKKGILGGTLSTGWELYNYDESKGKLKAKGKSKIDGVEVLKFDYSPKGGSDLDITIYLDAANYRHVRTEYKRVISGGQGATVDSSSRQNEKRYKMVEDFADFREEGHLSLPHGYKIYLELLTGNGTTSYTWTMEMTQFNLNPELDPKEFKVDGE